jgi:hypothetical protein
MTSDATRSPSEEILNMQRKRAQTTAVVVGMSSILCLIFFIHAFIQNAETRSMKERLFMMQHENQNLKEQLELCQSK